jgi:hypothetical protein
MRVERALENEGSMANGQCPCHQDRQGRLSSAYSRAFSAARFGGYPSRGWPNQVIEIPPLRPPGQSDAGPVKADAPDLDFALEERKQLERDMKLLRV